jgi:hypothetical protein
MLLLLGLPILLVSTLSGLCAAVEQLSGSPAIFSDQGTLIVRGAFD